MADYYTLLTNAGIAYETACKAAGLPIKLSQLSVGDGGGAVYNPAATDTALKREVWRGPLNALFQDEKNPSWLLAEVTIPPDVGGWYVREAGIWTDTGILYAIVKYPESFKPVLATSGSGKEFYIRSIFETSNASLVTLVIDDTVVKATRAWVMGYLADELGKLDGKQSVRAATTENIVLSGAQQIDGVAVLSGQRVLVVAQTAAKDNGIYVAANGAWLRATDANASIKVTPNLTVMVEEGAANGDSLWHLVTNGPITLGTTTLSFEMLAGRTGIQAGTYKSLTVDKYGRATAGTNPETLAGFGIKDTYTKPEIEAMIAQASALPVGAMVTFPTESVPPGFLEVDNSLFKDTLYPDLAACLNRKYNLPGDAAGYTRLPESRGEFVRGWDHGRGVDPGRMIGSWQKGSIAAIDTNLPATQTIASNIADYAASRIKTGYDSGDTGLYSGVTLMGVNPQANYPLPGGPEVTYGITRPNNVAFMLCIKAWNAPINQGNVDIAALATEVQTMAVNRGVVGDVRNGRMVLTAESATATYTADELVVKDAFGGRQWVLPNLALNINLATVGAGGMDSGTAPSSGYVAIYAIYNPVSRQAVAYAVNATSAVVADVCKKPMPAGYTASALVAVVATNASGQMLPVIVNGRRHYIRLLQMFTSMVNIANAPWAITNVVPPNAKSYSGELGLFSVNGGAMTINLATGAYGIGQSNFTNSIVAGQLTLLNFYDVAIETPQLTHITTSSNAGGPTFYAHCNGYSI
ncbi:phage tail protein [Pseudomonas sp. BGI-2]|uniref:phage tail-collar fiber domain-containing protein n=1 Tax=Pseudomonas sp. BGI-2 TaxID=2528211 RepID=UPI0021141A1A|nr:phage tail protein [Pseudomonas sp. BGI-2]